MAKEFDFSFIKDESGIEDVKDFKKEKDMLIISKKDFIETTSRISKQVLVDMQETAKKDGKELEPLMLMSEMLTHIALLSKITNELFKEGE